MTIKTVTFHQRSSGKTGQVLASPEVERIGGYTISNLRDLAKRSRGKAKLPVHPRSGKRILSPRTQEVA